MPASSAVDRTLWQRETFHQKLREVGMSRYHHLHPFHREMNEGRLTRPQIQAWAANRFYYQRNIPLKDAAILSNCPEREVRRLWLHRITDHDGMRSDEGGIEAWLQLAEATGLSRGETLDGRHVVPGVRFAVDAYVNFARQKPWPIAVASSLTELFAPDLMKDRLAAFERHYSWVRPEGLRYFRSRLTLARNDSAEALELTFTHCNTPELQHEAVAALSFKCDLLWAMLDANPSGRGREWRGAVSSPPIDAEHRPRLAAKARLRPDGPSGKLALLSPENVMLLNASGAAIVELCDGRSVAEIVSALGQRFAAPPERLRAEVIGYLTRLRDKGLIELAPEVGA